MIAAYHIFEFTTGLYYPSISSLKADSIPEETRAVIMTLIRIPMNLGVGVMIWQVDYINSLSCLIFANFFFFLIIDRGYVHLNDVFFMRCDDLYWMLSYRMLL